MAIKSLNAKYAVTAMQRGGYRAECFVVDCLWWRDVDDDESTAMVLLRQHMSSVHRIGVRSQTARAGT